MKNFVRFVLKNGGKISPIVINDTMYVGNSLFNPSIYSDNGKLIVNVRHCQYTILHSEKNIFEHQYGPLVYLHPEGDVTLTTKNYICELDNNLNVDKSTLIDTTLLDVPPLWEFVGLEDVRLVRWNEKLYAIGVRRDTTKTGVGRMELSEIIDYREVSRWRIPAPGADNSYCEKNWMPIIDMPFHLVKWTNPTEIVKINPENKTCETVFLGKYIEQPHDFRGGSQVIQMNDNYRIACVHTVDLTKTESGCKNGIYRHNFIVWDNNWNLIKITDSFDFMGAKIEFCSGMTKDSNGDYLMSFGFQDNAAYILQIPSGLMEEICLN